MADEPIRLVVMRYADMTRVHPRQDSSRVCSKCGHRVGIYPSGQAALKRDPAIEIVCHVCVNAGPLPDRVEPAGTIDEIVCEIEQSKFKT